MPQRKNNIQGQTLLEVVIALGVAVIVVSLIAIAVIFALNNATYSKNQNLATQFGQEGMEIVRQLRDSDLAVFNSLSGNYCLAKGVKILNDSNRKQVDCTQNVDIFKREVIIYPPSSVFSCPANPPATTAPLTKVQVIVSWSDNKCSSSDLFCHKVELASCLAN